jgi:hypothetical protein
VHVQFDDEDMAGTEPADVEIKRRGGTYMGNRQLVALFEKPGGKLAVPFKLERPIKGIARLHLNTGPNNGIWSVQIDGQKPHNCNRIDLFKETVEPVELLLGEVDLTTGEHILTFVSVGTNPAAADYHIAVSAITLEGIERFVAASEPDSR